ncbi:MAG: isoprenoid biosynthesis protein ElbB [Deltaproteobacteria bacterium RIFCSPLOWO2_12_FULL_40_28]|nr:MAG: isoprenoid biosynthesis protein ElbB [Deltaproteobacteria bacterium RIFCSPHIGHO2_02_FULL_40_28]OGQ19480.1 MAG: isoprenoid biosynthesis protein ElbB [Deltaproteobacteria bacterium RIFCSPHIGHO2_12_FULL_40_32]OGQ39954.1 MAG: isoprenoid biosynthesis protein ElbB [Deltaproteobacteria bacterium RIFCSPLOWO2_02_FULL_40_36]OGQ54372.1 MAG: isoprenoid biosynthesis protein ElbB [Deltaproteobacteria bacterium RIFCSPLOWO2_12_FULL_40_28]
MSKKIAVILAGCGFKDGSEIHESVLTLLHLVREGAMPLCFAPNEKQATVTNHVTGDAEGASRNILVESARITRGNIRDIKELKAVDADALILPGGYGAALNLCDFAVKGPNCTVNSQVQRVIQEFYQAKKPIGAICIAPAIVGKVLGSYGIELTIGSDRGTAQALEKMGAKHVNTTVENFHWDSKNKIASTAAYMLAQNIVEAESGISRLIKKVVDEA